MLQYEAGPVRPGGVDVRTMHILLWPLLSCKRAVKMRARTDLEIAA
jgi:hypothetical protein